MKSHILAISIGLTVLSVYQPTNAAERPDIICEAPGEPSSFEAIIFSPDSRLVLTLDDESRLWRISDTNLVQTFVILNLRDSMRSAVFSSDGAKVTGSGEDEGRQALKQWRVSDGSIVWQKSLAGSLATVSGRNLLALGWVEASQTLLLPMDGSSDGRPLGSTNSPSGLLAATRDGTFLAVANFPHVRIWQMSDETIVQTIKLPSGFYPDTLQFAPDGKTLALSLTNGIRLHSITNDAPPRMVSAEPAVSLRFSPDGKLLVTSAAGRLKFWRVNDGAMLKEYEDGLDTFYARLDISPDGKLFAYDRKGTLVVARMPLLITEAAVRTNAMHLDWQGGHGVYQVEGRTNLNAGNWEVVAGPLTSTNLSVPTTNPAGFYRVRSLSEPP